MSYEYQPTCILHFPLNEGKPCDFPCSEENCRTETYHFITCPQWTCFDKTTLSPIITTSQTPSECSGPLCLGLAIFLGIMTCFVLSTVAVLLFLKRTNRIHFGRQAEINSNRANVELGNVLERAQSEREREPLLDGSVSSQAGSQGSHPVSRVGSQAQLQNVNVQQFGQYNDPLSYFANINLND